MELASAPYRRVLASVLGEAGIQAADLIVDRFLTCLEAQSLQVDWWQAVESRGSIRAAVVGILSAARTVLILTTPCPRGTPAARALTKVLRDMGNRARDHGLTLMQALVTDPGDGQAEALREAGFSYLARLLYLAREAEPCPNTRGDVRLEPYCADRHELFVQTVAQTYAGSLDCPALSGVRSMDDAIATHRATGLHDPRLWFLAHDDVDEAPAGALLLTRVPLRSALEIVYLGVIPRARGRGLGRCLVRAALQRAHLEGLREVLLAVDAANHYAIDLYSAVGFEQTAERHAWIHALRSLT